MTAFFSCVFMLFFCWQLKAQSLDELFQYAEINNLSIKNAKIDMAISKEGKSQSLSQVLPSLSLNHTKNQIDGVSSSGSSSRNTRLSLSQSLFAGGAEYKALEIAENSVKYQGLTKIGTANNIKTQIAQYFYSVLSLQQELGLLETQEKAIGKRITELQKRKRIGRSRNIDVLSARSQVARVTAEKTNLQSEITKQKAALKALLNWESAFDLKDTLKLGQINVVPKNKEELLLNPNYEALKLSRKNAHLSMKANQAAHLPKLDLSANYYLDRTGTYSDSKWDLSLTASWDIYSGGYDNASIQKSALSLKKVENQLRNYEVTRALQFKRFQKEIKNRKETVSKLAKAVRLSKMTYFEYVKEMDLGLVSSLDVYRAEEDYMEVQRASVREEHSLKILWYQFQEFLGSAL